ncbi:hypothetical protein [Sphingomonas sp.]|uniref:hypothetical protein n=1 Tax=Sphingomonas sp. TaxID=28214 RepID=UPI003D6C87B8
MDALSFKNALQAAKPDMVSLLGEGLSSDEAADIIATFEVRERAVEQDTSLPDSTLNDLFARYDASNVEIGMVRFCHVPEQVSYGYIIGQVEADYLALEASSGEVTVRDITCPDHTIWTCARDGTSLLAALAAAAKYLGAGIAIDQSGSELQCQTLDRCILLAGGPAHGDFYRMLLGVE